MAETISRGSQMCLEVFSNPDMPLDFWPTFCYHSLCIVSSDRAVMPHVSLNTERWSLSNEEHRQVETASRRYACRAIFFLLEQELRLA